MEIKDVKSNQGSVDVVLDIIKKESPRTFEKFGKQGKVCNARAKDNSGEITITLWNEDVEKVDVGDKIHISNGWCSEYKGEKQLSTGKFGKIEVVKKATGNEVFSNDPEFAQGKMPKIAEEEEEQPEEEYKKYDDEFVE